jgi:hypothetical protein
LLEHADIHSVADATMQAKVNRFDGLDSFIINSLMFCFKILNVNETPYSQACYLNTNPMGWPKQPIYFTCLDLHQLFMHLTITNRQHFQWGLDNYATIFPVCRRHGRYGQQM